MQLSRRACALAAYVATGATARSLQASGEDFHMRVYDTMSCAENPEKDFIEVRFPAQTDLCDQSQTCFCAIGEGTPRYSGKTKVAVEFCFQEGSLKMKFFKGTSACDGIPDGAVPVDEFFKGGCTVMPEVTPSWWMIKAIDAGPLLRCADQRAVGGAPILPFRGGDGYFDLGIYDDLAQCESLLARGQSYADPADINYTAVPAPKEPRCNVCIDEDRYPLKLGRNLVIKYMGSVSCRELYRRGLSGEIDRPMCGIIQHQVKQDCGCPRRGGRRYGFRFQGELDMCDETKSCICAPGTDIIASKLKRALGICLKPDGGGVEVKLFDGKTTCVGSPAAVFQLQGSQANDFINGKCMSGRNGDNTAPLYLAKEAVESVKCLRERWGMNPSPPSPSPMPSPPSPNPSLPEDGMNIPSSPSPMPSSPSPSPPSSPMPSPPSPNPSLPEDGTNNPADEPADSSAIRSAMNGLRCTNGQAPLSWSADLEEKAKLETESKKKFKPVIEGEQRSLYIPDVPDVSSPKVIVEAMYTVGEGQKPGKKSGSRGLYDIITAWESGTAMACARLGAENEKKMKPGRICFFAEVDPATLASEDCGGYPAASPTTENSDADRESALETLSRMEEQEFGNTGGKIDTSKDIGGRSATLSALVAGCWCAVAAARV